MRTGLGSAVAMLASASIVLLVPLETGFGQTIVYVDKEATGANSGTSWGDAYTDLQSALAEPGPSVEVWVASATYVPGSPGEWESTFQLRSGLALYGGFAGWETNRNQRDWVLNETILSGDIDGDDVSWYPDPAWNGNAGDVFHVVTGSGADASAVIDGFTIIRGSTNYGGHTVPEGDLGSGMMIVGGNPAIANCVFKWNTASWGGAIYNRDGSPTVNDCVFTQNLVWWYKGAGICNTGVGSMEITRCRFVDNLSGGGTGHGGGAGIFNDWDARATVRACEFANNRSQNFYSAGNHDGAYGAGIYNLGDHLTIIDCAFRGNHSNAGSGVYSWGDSVLIAQCTFAANVAVAFGGTTGDWGDYGGALALLGIALDRATTIAGCDFTGNSAGEGGAIAAFGNLAIVRNSILWGNTATGQGTFPIDGQIKGDADFAYACVEALFEPIPGEDPPDPENFPGCIDQDPFFANPLSQDLHLMAGSPCIDAGDNAEVPVGVTTDLDGAERFFDDPLTPDSGSGAPPIVDMGAYEFGAPIVGVAPGSAGAEVAAAEPFAMRVAVRPNPFRSRVTITWEGVTRGGMGREVVGRESATGTPATAGADRIEIFDVAGRCVRSFAVRLHAGRGSVVWNGTDAKGRLLPPEVYFVRMSGKPGAVAGATARVLLLD